LLSVHPNHRFSNVSECLNQLRSFHDVYHWLNRSTALDVNRVLHYRTLRNVSLYVEAREFIESKAEETTTPYFRVESYSEKITGSDIREEEISKGIPTVERDREEMFTPPYPSLEPLEPTYSRDKVSMHEAVGEAENGKDIVDCTVFSVPKASAGDDILVHVFAHLPERSEEAAEMVREFDVDAKRRGVKTIDAEIQRGSLLSFRLEMNETLVDEPVKHLTWRGSTDSVQFFVKISESCRAKTLIGKVTIAQDSVPIGHVYFKLKIHLSVADEEFPETAHSEPTGMMKRYNYAFISYASTDRAEVLRRIQMLDIIKIQYFQDVLSLDPGVRWQKELYRHIDNADVFFLFWSKAARDSQWVIKEVKYAIALKHGEDENPPEIIPVIIEGPPIPEPPKALEHIHFNDRFMYFISCEDRQSRSHA